MIDHRKHILLGEVEYHCTYFYHPEVNLDDEQENEHVELLQAYSGPYNVIEHLDKEIIEKLEDRCLLAHHG